MQKSVFGGLCLPSNSCHFALPVHVCSDVLFFVFPEEWLLMMVTSCDWLVSKDLSLNRNHDDCIMFFLLLFLGWRSSKWVFRI